MDIIEEEEALASMHSVDTQEESWAFRAANLQQEAVDITQFSRQSLAIVKVLEGASLVDYKWVSKTQLNEEGEVIKGKARFFARGFTREHGVNCFDTYSPVQAVPHSG